VRLHVRRRWQPGRASAGLDVVQGVVQDAMAQRARGSQSAGSSVSSPGNSGCSFMSRPFSSSRCIPSPTGSLDVSTAPKHRAACSRTDEVDRFLVAEHVRSGRPGKTRVADQGISQVGPETRWGRCAAGRKEPQEGDGSPAARRAASWRRSGSIRVRDDGHAVRSDLFRGDGHPGLLSRRQDSLRGGFGAGSSTATRR